MEQQNKQPEKNKKSPIRYVIIAAIVIVAGIYGWREISYSIEHESTDDAQVETQISPVLPRVSGYVKLIDVKDYDSVKAGQLFTM